MPVPVPILECFPAGLEPRDGQRIALETVEKNWDKADVFVINIPTGGGKSAVSLTLAKWANKAHKQKTFIGVPTNILRDQLIASAPRLFTLRKRHEYSCLRSTEQHPISCETWCADHAKPCTGCPHTKANRQARVMPYQVGNFYTYLAHRLYQDVVIFDECFPGDQLLLTQLGPRTIQEVALNPRQYQVLSWNLDGHAEFKQVLNGWEKNGTQKRMLKITADTSQIQCTDNHKLLTASGWKVSGDLRPGDILIHSGENDKTRSRLLSKDAEQVFWGSWLGDGGVQKLPKSSRKYRLRFLHGEKQFEYARWKASAFMNNTERVIEQNGYSGKPALQISTRSFFGPEAITLTAALDTLGPLGLAIWFMDDGSIGRNVHGEINQASLHTNAFSEDENNQMAEWFQRRWNIDAQVSKASKPDGRVFFYLRFCKEATHQLLSIIEIYQHPSMSYKFSQTKPLYRLNAFAPAALEIKAVEEVGSAQLVYDIEVEDNHNFICIPHKQASSGVVAHNCHLLLGMIKDLAAKNLWWHDYSFPHSVRDYRSLLRWCKDELAKIPADVEKLRAKRKRLEILHADLVSGAHRYLVARTNDQYRGRTEEVLKLLPIDTSAQPPVLWPQGKVKKIILLSATIGPKDIEQMGLSERRVCWVSMPSPIPPERRPVVVDRTFDVSYAAQGKDLDVLAAHILELAARHEGERGLIHCTYGMMGDLRRRLEANPRFMFHGKSDKNAKYAEFLEAGSDAILVCAGLYEGIDLPGDLGRWQVLTKCPWPSLAEPAIKWLAEADRERYMWECLKIVMQGCGRVCRGPEDFGVSFITDKSFRNFPVELMPPWFQQALAAGEKYVGHR